MKKYGTMGPGRLESSQNAPRAAKAEGAPEVPRTDVLGLSCSDTTLNDAARKLVGCAAGHRACRVAFVNAHSINVSVRDTGLQRALRHADVIYADGVGMAIAAWLQGSRLHHNVNGTDLFPHLCRQAAERGVGLALLGGEPGIAADCARIVETQYPGLEVVWHHHGFFDERDEQVVVGELNESGAGILLVATGVPKQERWIMEHREELRIPVVMGVGGLFDFVCGRVPRAPVLIRRLRMEWVFRLLMEPRRLFRRYVIGNPLFLARALKYSVTGSLWSAPGARRAAK